MTVLPSRSRLLLLTLVLLLAASWSAPPPTAGASLDQSRQSLKHIQQRILRTRKSLERKKQSEKSLRSNLAAVGDELAQLRRQVAALKQRLTGLDKKLAAKQGEIDGSRQHIAELQGQLRKRLVVMYKGQGTGLLRILFTNDSPARMAEEYDYLGRIVRRDRQLLADYRRALDSLQHSRADLEALRREQGQALEQGRQQQATLAQAVQLKQELLSRVRHQRRTLAARLDELRAQEKRLRQLIKKLERNKSPEYTQNSGIFAAQKGRLPWPVAGAIRIGFGTWRHPELGTLYDSQGIEIAAAAQAPIKAVWSGRVVYASWFKGYGNLLIIDHGGGYFSLYARASRLTRKVGDVVAGGSVVGYAGAERGRVYFQIRKGGTPLDPTAWLAPR